MRNGSPFFLQLHTTALTPGPPRNLTFHFYLDFETNKFRGNATWLGPEMPEGRLIEYKYVLSSTSASTIVGGTISVKVCQCICILHIKANSVPTHVVQSGLYICRCDTVHSFCSHKYVYIIQGKPAATDMSKENFVTFSADLTEQEYFNFSVSLTKATSHTHYWSKQCSLWMWSMVVMQIWC